MKRLTRSILQRVSARSSAFFIATAFSTGFLTTTKIPEKYMQDIHSNYDKYVDIFDDLIRECQENGDPELLKSVCRVIAKRITCKVYREMKMKNVTLCSEVVKANPYMLLETPKHLQTAETCNIAMKTSNYKCFCWVNPQLQTHEMAVNAVIADPENIKYVRKDLIKL